MRRLFLALLLPLTAAAVEIAPWYDTAYQFHLREEFRYQTFEKFAGEGMGRCYPSNDVFLTVSADGAIVDPWTYNDGFAFEIGTMFAKTRRRSFSFDHAYGVVRYRIFNDITGDPVSFIASLKLSCAYKQALFDPASFHHGLYEAEANLSFGKEIPCGFTWHSRWWGLIALGMAERGSPWARANFTYEFNQCDCHIFSLFAESLLGFGNDPMIAPIFFHGYGPIKHRSLDIGVRYTQLLGCESTIGLAALYRPYARNFPQNATQVILYLDYPFGL